MFQQIKSYLIGALLGALLATIGRLLLPTYVAVPRAIADVLVTKLTPLELIELAAALFLISVLLCVFLINAYRKPILLRDYVKDPDWMGVFRHKRDLNTPVCGVCLSPVFVSRDNADHLACNKCSREIVRIGAAA